MNSQVLALCAIACIVCSPVPAKSIDPKANGRARFLEEPHPGAVFRKPAIQAKTPAQMGLRFERNQGQQPPSVQFLSAPARAQFAFLRDRVELWVNDESPRLGPAVSMRMVGSGNPAVRGDAPLPGKSNYFVGKDPRNWRTGVAAFEKVRYSNVWPGIDMVFYGKSGEFEFDLIVAPGADPSKISLAFDGVKPARIDATGALVLESGSGTLKHRSPHIYQVIGGESRPIAGRFILQGDRQAGFSIDAYDHAEPLIIDPVLEYSTFLGSSQDETAFAIAVDPEGRAVVAGITRGTIPGNRGVNRGRNGNNGDGFVARLNAAGTQFEFIDYLGGNFSDNIQDVGIDAAGNIYVTGYTTSSDFPVTDSSVYRAAEDVFLAKLSPQGNQLLFSTLIGGTSTDWAFSLAVGNNSVFVCGLTASDGFGEGGSGTRLSKSDAFFARYSPTGTRQDLQAFGFPGDPLDTCTSVAYEPARDLLHAAFFSKPQTTRDSTNYFVVLTEQLQLLNARTVTIGGGSGYDEVYRMTVDAAGNRYATGLTESTNWANAGPVVQSNFGGGGWDAFVAVASANDQLVYSSLLGGSAEDFGLGIATNGSQLFVSGITSSPNFPVRSSAFQTGYGGGGSDGFLVTFNGASRTLSDASFFGGENQDEIWSLALDGNGDLYFTGSTRSKTLPVIPGAAQTTASGGWDVFVSKLNTGNCQLGLSRTFESVGAGSGSGTVNVGANNQTCTWRAEPLASWITLASPPFNTGSQTLAYNIASNATGVLRRGSLRVGNQILSLVQFPANCAVSVEPGVLNIPGGGQARRSLAVTTDSACSWDARTTDNWITLTGAAGNKGSGRLEMEALPNPDSRLREGRIDIAGRPVRVVQDAGSSCLFTLSTVSGALYSAGGLGKVDVIASKPSCSWTAGSSVNWISVPSFSAKGTGSGQVRFTVGPLTAGGNARTGSLTIAGQQYQVLQVSFSAAPDRAGGDTASSGTSALSDTIFEKRNIELQKTCLTSPMGAKLNAGPQGGPVPIDFTTQASNCTINVKPALQFVKGPATSAPNSPKHTVQLTVDPNPTSQERSSVVHVYADGNTPALFTVVQAGQGGCRISATPDKTDVPATGGTRTLAITAPPGCTWLAQESDPWVKVLSDKSGSGNSSLTYQVDVNASPEVRTAAIQVNDEVQADVTQLGKDLPPPPCLLTLTPEVSQAGSDGGDFTIDVSANQGGCNWTASTAETFLSFPFGASKTGTQSLSFRVAPNPQGSGSRQGSLTIGDQTVVVRQSAGPKAVCSYAVAPLSFNSVPAAGQTVNVSVSTTQECAWTAASSSSFVTVSGGSAGQGPGAVTLVIAANGGAARQGSVSVANRTVVVSQLAGRVTPPPPAVLTLSPDPIRSCTNGLGRATLRWNIPGAGQVSLRVASPTGPEMGKFGEAGSAETGDWVTDGMEFFLVDSAGRTLARAVARLQCLDGPPVELTASPNPIQVCFPATAGKTTLTWSAVGNSGLSLRVNSPTGANMGNVDSRGSTETGDWVTDGMTFFLVGPNAQVLAQTTVRHTSQGCAAAGAPPPTADLVEGDVFVWKAEGTKGGQPVDLILQQETTAVQDGQSSLFAVTTMGDRIALQYPLDPSQTPLNWDMRATLQASFWLITDAVGQTQFLSTTPKLVLYSAGGSRTLTPSRNLIASSLGRWLKLSAPLDGGADWTVTDQGNFDRGNVTRFSFEVQANGPGIALLWDGLRFGN